MYSYTDEEIYVNAFGNIYVEFACIDAVIVSYSVTGCISGNAAISIYDAVAAYDADSAVILYPFMLLMLLISDTNR